MSERTSAVPTTAHFDCAALLARLPTAEGERSIEAFRHGSLLVKLYAPRGHDPQTPHTRDEAYVVVQGEGQFWNGTSREPFRPGTFLFARAGQPHRFEEFSDDLAVWVLYYGPEGGELGRGEAGDPAS